MNMHAARFRRPPPFSRLDMIAGKAIAEDRAKMKIEPVMWATMEAPHQAGYYAMGKAALDSAFAEMGIIGKLVRWWFT